MECQFCKKLVTRPYFSERHFNICMSCQVFLKHKEEILNILINPTLLFMSDKLARYVKLEQEKNTKDDSVPV